MIFDQDIPKFLWGEAAMTVVYIQNRSPHRILDNMIPEEAFKGRKPCVYHLRIFGCPTYIHVPKDKQKQLDSTSIKGIFVHYILSPKAYRIHIKEGRGHGLPPVAPISLASRIYIKEVRGHGLPPVAPISSASRAQQSLLPTPPTSTSREAKEINSIGL